MTKAGLEGLTKGMAIDLAKNNIRVNTVCPTFVVTPMTKKFLKNKKFKKETLNNIPLGRFAEMSEIASTLVILLCQEILILLIKRKKLLMSFLDSIKLALVKKILL